MKKRSSASGREMIRPPVSLSIERLVDTGTRWGSITSVAKKHGPISNVVYFGKDKLLSEITDNDVSRLVAWRRGQRKWERNNMQLIAPATVNPLHYRGATKALRTRTPRLENAPGQRARLGTSYAEGAPRASARVASRGSRKARTERPLRLRAVPQLCKIVRAAL